MRRSAREAKQTNFFNFSDKTSSQGQSESDVNESVSSSKGKSESRPAVKAASKKTSDKSLLKPPQAKQNKNKNKTTTVIISTGEVIFGMTPPFSSSISQLSSINIIFVDALKQPEVSLSIIDNWIAKFKVKEN